MKNSLSLVLFVFIMGVISSLVLTGANYFTADRIAKNAELTWKSAILSHHDVSFNQTNFAEVFDETFEVETKVNPANNKELNLYTNLETGRASFQFEGNGLWDKILGVITLEEDFYTIKAISVTEQGETPGLGGIVAEKPYLAKYVGKKFGESSGLVVVKNSSSADNEVDMITGATGTSTAFANLLNQQHRLYLTLFKGVSSDALWMREILNHNEIESTSDNYASLFDEFIDVMTEDNLDLYFHKSNGNISFKFEDKGYEGKTLKGVVTIKDDWETIVGLSVYEQEEQRGAATLANPDVLGAFIGKRFDPTIVMSKNPSADNEVEDLFLHDDGTGVTFTKDGVVNGLNNAYILYYQTFKDKDFNPVDITMPWKIAMLKNHDIDANENNYTDLFKHFFIEETKNDLTLYLGKDTRTISILFEIDGFSEETSKGILTLENDFKTIKAISIYENNENRAKDTLNDPLVLAKFIGFKFNPDIIIDDITDDFTEVTKTKDGFEAGLNDSYLEYYNAFEDINMPWMLSMLHNNGHDDANESNYLDLFNNNFTLNLQNGLTLYTHNTDKTNNIIFIGDGFNDGKFALNNGINSIHGVLTLDEDFVTIVSVNVFYNNENRGKPVLYDEQILSNFIGKKFDPSIVIKEDATLDNEVLDEFYNVDNETSVSQTRDAFQLLLNTIYQRYYLEFVVPKKSMLDNNNISYNNSNYQQLFETSFNLDTKDDLTIYINKDTGFINFLFVGDGFTDGPALPEGGPGTIKGIITLEDDFLTIYQISVYENHERWGAETLEYPQVLGAFTGKKFSSDLVFSDNPSLDNEVEDNFYRDPDKGSGSTVSGTKDGIINALNDTYTLYYNNFKEGN